jgi:hypothetical protein
MDARIRDEFLSRPIRDSYSWSGSDDQSKWTSLSCCGQIATPLLVRTGGLWGR